MQTPEQALDQIDQLLEEERTAIRLLDGERVQAICDEKLALMQNLQTLLDGREDLAPKLQSITAGLRRNAVLLANARDCLRDVLAAIPGAPQPALNAASTAPIRLSLRG